MTTENQAPEGAPGVAEAALKALDAYAHHENNKQAGLGVVSGPALHVAMGSLRAALAAQPQRIAALERALQRAVDEAVADDMDEWRVEAKAALAAQTQAWTGEWNCRSGGVCGNERATMAALPQAHPDGAVNPTPQTPAECSVCGGLVVGVAAPSPAEAPEIGEVTWQQAADAIEDLDDFASMLIGVDASGARETLYRFLEQTKAALANVQPKGMPVGLVIEAAHSGDKLIGHRLTLNGACPLLVWADQAAMPGFRVGDAFVAGLGETITYAPATQAPAVAHESASQEPDPNNPGWCIGCNPDNCEGCGNGLPVQVTARAATYTKLWTRHSQGEGEWWSLGKLQARKEGDDWVVRRKGAEVARHEFLQVAMAEADTDSDVPVHHTGEQP